MPASAIHRFEHNGRRFAIDPETCFCFECDAISWDVLEWYPHTAVNRIYHVLADKHDAKELREVISELEWLRGSRSILQTPPPEQYFKQFEVERGVRALTVALPRNEADTTVRKSKWFGRKTEAIPLSARELGRDAVNLLLSRSMQQPTLHITFLEEGGVANPDLMTELCAYALRIAGMSGKKLTAAIHVANIPIADAPAALAGHRVDVRVDFDDAAVIAPHVEALSRETTPKLARLAKLLANGAAGARGRIIIRPNHADYGETVKVCHEAGFTHIELDLDGMHAANPSLEPAAMLPGLSASAVYYAQSLLQGKYFRLDPIAALFYRIHEGKPMARYDISGTNALAVDADGGVYPSWRFLGDETFRYGDVREGRVDEEKLTRFDDVGSLTTGPCRQCWARNLCGGGNSAVHQAYTGSFRLPHAPWCDMQRAWMTAAVSAFNLLSSEGVNFSRVYSNLTPGQKPSLWTMAKAAFQMTVSMRPAEESDAPMLTKWENWNEASYFTCNPSSIFLSTLYDHEMDALHPRSMAQELILTRRDGTAFGLLRLTPGQAPGIASLAVYFHDPADYAAEEVRKGFRLLLSEAGKQQGLRRLTVEAADREPALQAFLESLGFQKAGVQREALFLHGQRHDVSVYVLAVGG